MINRSTFNRKLQGILYAAGFQSITNRMKD